MHAVPRPDRLAKALREYGRLVRTNFILDWVGDPDLRARGLGQLNKGESANALHRYVGFGNRGRVHARDPEQLQRHMDCRRLISNVIVYWNTRYIAHALETLERQGNTLRDEDIRHIHPAHYEGATQQPSRNAAVRLVEAKAERDGARSSIRVSKS